MRNFGQGPQRRQVEKAIYLLFWLIVMLGWWLMLVDTLALAEVLAGVAAAAIAAFVALETSIHGDVGFRPRLRWLVLLGPIPAGVLRDSVVLVAALWRCLARRERFRGAFRAVHFPVGAEDPESAAWRAFTTAATSITPNTYVIGFDRERGLVLVHQLVPDEPERLRRTVVGSSTGH